MQRILTSTRTLWIALLATLLLTFSFPMAANQIGIAFVDALSDPDETRTAIAAMSSAQRTAHAWVTATLDVAYPIAYCALFAGSALVFFPRLGKVLWPVFAVLLASDLIEGIVQILALTDAADLLAAKAFLTPLKFALALAGLGLTVAGWVKWIVTKVF